MSSFPVRVSALEIHQPLGRFFVAAIPARILLEVCYSHTATARLERGGYVLDGNQRFTQDRRLTQIAEYVARSDSSFPNAIILAVDTAGEEPEVIDPDAGERVDSAPTDVDAANSWLVDMDAAGRWTITIPTAARLAAVVDGQHRLFAFAKEEAEPNLDMPMICSVFFDLPKPFQAQLFATINSTQKRVDKSLTYELFGYNVAEEPEESWTPEKLAVFLTRKLNVETESPLHGRIMVAPRRDAALEALTSDAAWRVSTAVVVEGLMRLYSANPRRDANRLLTSFRQRRSVLAAGAHDKTPMRNYYVDGKDEVLYRTASNYLTACDALFWRAAGPRSFITKTVGIQALFDVLRLIVTEIIAGGSIRIEVFENRLAPAADINFAGDRFRNASGSGRTVIKAAIIEAIG